MSPRRRRSNPLALAVLCCLYERPMHPYEMATTMKDRAKHESIKLNYGSLYNVVAGLERDGFIFEQETTREGKRPERTIYAITPSGTTEMVDWLSDMVARPAPEYLQFEGALSMLPALPPEDALALLRTRATAIELELARGRATAQAVIDHHQLPRLFLIEHEFSQHRLEAELEFVERLVKDIESGELEGLAEWRSWFDGDEPWGIGSSDS